MEIHEVDHVEFYVGDAQQSAHYLCTAYGFTVCGQAGPETGLTGQRSLLLRQGRIQILLTSALTSQHPAAAYVSRHGDGVAVIAFRVTDARTAYAEAVDRGATGVTAPANFSSDDASVTLAEISGFGDVTHRLVERQGQGGDFLPGVFELLALDPEIEVAPASLDIIDHFAICLPAGTLASTVDFYRDALGFSQIFEEYIEVGRQAMDSKVVQSPSGGVTLTLIEPDTTREPGQIDRFLASHGGPGVQHIAFLTDDITSTIPVLEKRGVEFLKTPAAYYDQLAPRLGSTDIDVTVLKDLNILVDRDHWGDVFQIFSKSMHIRGTYFTEIIDRHGARTFGSGNIKALYEAVDRGSMAESPGR